MAKDNPGLDLSQFDDVAHEFAPVTPEVATELERMGAGAAETWMGLQKQFDEAEHLQPKIRGYRYVIEREEGAYGIYFPDLPGCVSAGRTRGELLSNAEEAINLHLD